MESNGSVNPSEVATLSLLGGGGGGGGLFNRGSFADDGSNAVRINRNSDLNSQSHDFLSQQISDNADRNRDITSDIRLNSSFERMADKTNDQTRFFAQEVNMLAREQTANAREAAKCCCETQKLITSEASATRTLVLEVEARGVRDSLAAANAKISQLETINALSVGHGRG